MSKKETAVAFLHLAGSGKAREAFRSHVGVGFRHHNPWFRGDAESLMIAMDENAAQNPAKKLEVLRAIEEGDLVAYTRGSSSDRRSSARWWFTSSASKGIGSPSCGIWVSRSPRARPTRTG